MTYDEIVDILDVIYIPGSTMGYTIPPRIYEIGNIKSMLKSLFSGNVTVNIATDDIRLKSILNSNKTIRFTEKSFFLLN